MDTLKHILLVDDEPGILNVLRVFLVAKGFKVFTAANGHVALKKLSEHHFDAVVCDYSMPQMDGITLLKQVRQGHDETPFIFFSGHICENQALTMKSLGTYQFLQKPNIKPLIELLMETIEKNNAA